MCTMSIFRIWSFAFCMLAYVSIICTQALKDCFAHRDCISLNWNLMKVGNVSWFKLDVCIQKNIWHILYTILLYIDENVLPEIFLD